MLLDGEEIRVTPLFLGASPAEIRNGSLSGNRVLAPNIDLALSLVESMSQRQIGMGKDDSEPNENGYIERGIDRNLPKAIGLSAGDMTTEQKETLMSLVGQWAHTFHPVIAAREIERIERAGTEALVVQWMGKAELDQRFYLQVIGPTMYLQIEMLAINPMTQVFNHIHSVWGDPTRDFGQDLLKEHNSRSHGPETNLGN
jgi:hypothetical protein